MISSVLSFIVANYLIVMAIYLAGGVIYSLVKWVLMLLKLRRRVNSITEAQINKRMRDYSNKTSQSAIASLRSDAAYAIFNSMTYPPKVSDNTGTLMSWAIFWPINLIYTLFADIAIEFFGWVWDQFSALYDYLATAILPK